MRDIIIDDIRKKYQLMTREQLARESDALLGKSIRIANDKREPTYESVFEEAENMIHVAILGEMIGG